MPRKIEKCPCGHAACKDWHVSPEAAIQGVKFTEEQATQVGILLDMRDRESSKPTVSVGDVSQALVDALADNIGEGDVELFPPNAIVMIRADVLSIAIHEIEMLRGQLRDREMLAGAIGGFRTKEGIEP